MSDEREYEKEPLRDRLIVAGMNEIATHGVADFSLRRVSAACGISCAAPYKHFKNKDEFILEIIRYIRHGWTLLRDDLCRIYADDPERRLIEVAIAYIRFFASNPHYRAVLVAAGEDDAGADLSRPMEELAAARGFDEGEKNARLYALRALLYGMTAMLENGELHGTPENYAMIREAVTRTLL